MKFCVKFKGFNEDYVFLSDDKKRGLSHANLRSSLKYDDKDACMSHALEVMFQFNIATI